MTIIVSLSEIAKAQTCTQEWFYHSILGLEPIAKGKALKRGDAGHRMLENFYKNLSKMEDKDQAFMAMDEWVAKNFEKNDDNMRAFALVSKYIQGLEVKGFSLSVEKEYHVPIDDFFTIACRPDLFWSSKQGKSILEDYKFIGKMWTSRKLSRYVQLRIYRNLLRLLNYNVDYCLVRFFNVENGSIKDKPFFPEEPLDTNIQEELVRAGRKVAELKAEVWSTLEEDKPDEARKLVDRTHNINTCNWCSFEFICTLELEGKSAEKTIANLYQQSKYGYKMVEK